MRTTIELSDEQRAELLRLAAKRGEKGFSAIVREAISQYLAGKEARDDRIQTARSLLGTLTEAEARQLEKNVADLRSTWR